MIIRNIETTPTLQKMKKRRRFAEEKRPIAAIWKSPIRMLTGFGLGFSGLHDNAAASRTTEDMMSRARDAAPTLKPRFIEREPRYA